MDRNNEAKLKADLVVAEALQKTDSEGYPKLTEEHPFFGRLRCFMADRSHWLGTATDLLNAMNDTATPPNTVTKLLNKFCISVTVLMCVSDEQTERESLSSIIIGAEKNKNRVTDLLTV